MGRPRYKPRSPRSNAADRPVYRSSTNSTSVRIPARRQRRANKKTVSMLPSAPFHHNQLPAIPLVPTRPVTTSGVSAANVVATIEVPASHQGRSLPERKYCVRLEPARRAYQVATANGMASVSVRAIQSSAVKDMSSC